MTMNTLTTEPNPRRQAELMATLEGKKAQLIPRFRQGFLQRERAVFQFNFDVDEPFYLQIDGADLDLQPGQHPQPTINLYIDNHQTCWGLLDGRVDGMEAFLRGQYRADGNIVLSQLLLYLFRSYDSTIAYEVQD